MKYQEELKMYLKNKDRMNSTIVGLYNIIWGQCSKRVQNRCKAHSKYKEITKDHDVAELLKIIRDIGHEFETRTHLFDAMDHAIRRFYTY